MARTTSVIAAAAAAAVASAAVDRSLYALTPVGWMLKHCVHNFESGTTLERVATGAVVATRPDGSQLTLPQCNRVVNGVKMPLIHQERSMFSTRGGAARQLQFPPDYDGWLEYAAFNDTQSTGFNTFTGNFSVPAQPSSPPDVLYVFPGLQNIDWIPIVDPEPSAPFDIIQPVLQYPGDNGLYWSVKSWWVTLDVGAMASNEVQLSPGDVVFGNMTRTGKAAYYIDSVSTATGQHTALTAKGIGARLESQPWAYVTLECYGCTSCSTYPPGNAHIAFTGMAITQADGSPVSPAWKANPKPSKNRVCKESIDIVSPTEVNVYFGAP